jgi:hypothetical protein
MVRALLALDSADLPVSRKPTLLVTAQIDQLLERLDTALGKVLADDSVIDEVLPEIKRRRSR